MIDVKGLYKSFGDHEVLTDLNEHIHPGEKVVIIGRSEEHTSELQSLYS